MKQFELRFLDIANSIAWMRVFYADDDLGALSEAERLSTSHTIEIWEAGRKVARVKKGNLELTAQDRIGG